MHYPIPTNAETYFQYSSINKQKIHSEQDNQKSDFSWNKKCKYMDEYLNEVRRLEHTFKSIPFVDQIYLCNSLTFNALDKNSDIDLFIIAKPGRIRTVKLRSMILFTLKGAKRFGTNTRKKICLSFFITSDNQNLYPISLPSLDIYLCYRIAHLVLIYQSEDKGNINKSDFFSQNKWIKGVIPNFPEKQTISLGIETFTGNSKLKNIIQFIGRGVVGNIGERFAKHIQKPIIRLKISRNPEKNKDVIVSDSMLKFHKDIREKISLLYSVKIK